MDQQQILGALLVFCSLGLAVWVAVGVIELITERHERNSAPAVRVSKPEPVVWPERPEWAIDGTGRHRKA